MSAAVNASRGQHARTRLLRLSWILVRRLIRRQEQTAIQLARIRTAGLYVSGIRTVRSVFLFELGLLVLIGWIIAGFVLFHIGLFFCLPWSVRARAVLLMILGAVYCAIPLIVLLFCSRDRFWMKATGADKVVANALKGNALCKDR